MTPRKPQLNALQHSGGRPRTSRRVLIVEPHPDVHKLLELSLERLGYTPLSAAECGPGDADAVVLEPSWTHGKAILRRLGDVPPVVCLSIYPREAGFAPPESVAYLIKPASLDQLREALDAVCAA